YFGDIARVPYGTKGAGTVVKYAASCANYLVSHGVKAIVIACNTVSAVALEQLRIDHDLPVLGVIEPGARAAVGATKTGRIGVLATPGTIHSQAYTRAVTSVSTRTEVFGQAAPLLVPLAEEGWLEGDVPRLAARRYLEPLARAEVDVVVLGCTHYPLFFSLIEEEAKKMIGDHVRVIDSASTVAAETRSFFESRGLSRGGTNRSGEIRLFVTDIPRSFNEMARRFLGAASSERDEDLPEAVQVSL
ncbi:MAG TPA: glutamate racemase, partial [Polyangiaceae bacterium]|nr:glutamate racemase [Polyangiaceae bacterium]